MFSRFTQVFAETDFHDAPGLAVADPIFAELFARFGGRTFGNGIYRVHSGPTSQTASKLANLAFPQLGGRVRCFAFDWLGRHFCCDFDASASSPPRVVVLEPGGGGVLRIPGNFAQFHDEVLPDYTDAVLEAELFEEWALRTSDPLKYDECVGYAVPLYLGGEHSIENLRIQDRSSYWTWTTQHAVH